MFGGREVRKDRGVEQQDGRMRSKNYSLLTSKGIIYPSRASDVRGHEWQARADAIAFDKASLYCTGGKIIEGNQCSHRDGIKLTWHHLRSTKRRRTLHRYDGRRGKNEVRMGTVVLNLAKVCSLWDHLQ